MAKSFEDFANSTIKASAILTEEEIEILVARNNAEDNRKLWLYAYRIAAFVTVYCRQKLPTGFDETDWQDAVNECMTEYPKILTTYKVGEGSFLRYMSNAFQYIIRRYMWTVYKGGMGGGDSAAGQPLSYDQALESAAAAFAQNERNAMEDQTYDNLFGNSEAFGTRDPLIEAMAEDDVRAAFKLAQRTYEPSGKPGRPWTPIERVMEA